MPVWNHYAKFHKTFARYCTCYQNINPVTPVISRVLTLWRQRLGPAQRPNSFRQVIESYKRAGRPVGDLSFRASVISGFVTSWPANRLEPRFTGYREFFPIIRCRHLHFNHALSVDTGQYYLYLFITVHTTSSTKDVCPLIRTLATF